VSIETTSSKTVVDFTAVGQRRFRDCLRSALSEISAEFRESDTFWDRFTRSSRTRDEPTLVMADLASMVREFRGSDVHDWTASVRRVWPYFVAFVRTDRDRRCAPFVDDLLRASDMRINICNDADDWATINQCLRAGITGLRPDALHDARFLPQMDGLWVQFGDGLAGMLTWDALGVADVRDELIPESARVSSTGTTLEVVTRDAGLFEIDAASARAVLDQPFSAKLLAEATRHDEDLGTRLRRAREHAGLTQAQLGERTALDQAVISRIENGRIRPRIDTLRRLADGLAVSVRDLFAT